MTGLPRGTKSIGLTALTSNLTIDRLQGMKSGRPRPTPPAWPTRPAPMRPAGYRFSQAIPSRSRSDLILAAYNALLRLKVVTRLPDVLSRAPGLPTPCG